MSKWQKAPDGRERRRIQHVSYDITLHGWAYRQTEAEALEEMSWVEWDNKLIDAEYVDDDCLEEEHDA